MTFISLAQDNRINIGWEEFENKILNFKNVKFSVRIYAQECHFMFNSFLISQLSRIFSVPLKLRI
jgi:hypothetical protein